MLISVKMIYFDWLHLSRNRNKKCPFICLFSKLKTSLVVGKFIMSLGSAQFWLRLLLFKNATFLYFLQSYLKKFLNDKI